MSQSTTQQKPNVLLWLDDHRGQYIPRGFANSFANRDKDVTGVTAEQWAILEAGPEYSENERYWDVWQEVCDDAQIHDMKNNITYRIYQDGACWLVPEGMVYDEGSEFFVWPEAQDNEKEGT